MEKQSSLTTLKDLAVEIWDEHGKTILIVAGILLALLVGGGLYRVSKGEPFWGSPETDSERASRLVSCAEVDANPPTAVQQLDSPELSGVCSGFSRSEIEQTQAELGL